jgi:hypothetical protein
MGRRTQYVEEKASTCACKKELLLSVIKDTELLKLCLGVIAIRQVVVSKKLLSTEQETVPLGQDKKNVASSVGSLEAADHTCALLKEMLLSLENDTDLLRSTLLLARKKTIRAFRRWKHG